MANHLRLADFQIFRTLFYRENQTYLLFLNSAIVIVSNYAHHHDLKQPKVIVLCL